MRRKAWQIALFFGLCLLDPTDAAGQALDVTALSAGDLGSARSASPTLSAPSAIWGNPGFLIDSPTRLYLGLGIKSERRAIQRGSLLVNQPLPETRDSASPLVSPRVVLALPLAKNRFWLAIGYRPALRIESAFKSAVDPNPARYLGDEFSLADHRVSLGVALKLGRLRLGAAAEIGAVSLEVQRSLWVGFVADKGLMQVASLDSKARLSLSGVNFAARLGIGLIATSWLRLGLSARVSAKSWLSGDVTLTRPQRAPGGYRAVSATGGTAKLWVGPPLELSVGLALRPHRRLGITAAFRFEGASRFDGLTATLSDARYRLVSTQTSEHRLERLPLGIQAQDRFSLRCGAELTVVEGFLRARLGWAFERGATPDDAPHSALLDLDRHLIGVSAQATIASLRLAVGVAHSLNATLDSDGARTDVFNPLEKETTSVAGQGRFDTSSTRVIFEAQLAW